MDRSSYDRFSSREDIDLSEDQEYEEGYKARNQGKTLDNCPYPIHTLEREIWMAGWADADQGLLSDQECASK
jgi:ribosome modulation factor